MRETSRTCNFPRTTHGGKAEIVMWRRLHTVRPAPAPWRDSHVNIYHDYYYFNPPKILSTHTTTKQGFQVSTHLAFHFHSVAVRISQRLRLIKAPIHFFPVWRKKKKKKSSVAFAHRERGSGPGLSALKKILPVRFFHRTSCFFHLPDFFFLFSVRSDRHEGGLHERAGGVRLAALTWGVWVKFWKWHQPSLKKTGFWDAFTYRTKSPTPSVGIYLYPCCSQ